MSNTLYVSSEPLIKLLSPDAEVQKLTAVQSLKIVLIHNDKLRKQNEILTDLHKPLKKMIQDQQNLLHEKNKKIKDLQKSVYVYKNRLA